MVNQVKKFGSSWMSWSIVLFLLGHSHFSFAQQQQLYFNKLTSKEGLSENVVNVVYQDSKGFMWFGTNDGLNKFDGYEFTIYQPDDERAASINSNLVFALTEDHYERLWVGTTGKGLNYFSLSNESFRTLRHQPNDENSLSNDFILRLLTDRMGRIWVATVKGLDVITFDKNREPRIKRIAFSTKEPSVTTIFEDKKGNILVGTRQGMFKINLPNDLDKIRAQPISITDYSSNYNVYAIEEDHRGRLILATNSGLFMQRQPYNDATYEKLDDLNTVYSIVEDETNQIWIGSYSGLFHFDNRTANSLPTLVNQYTVSSDEPDGIGNNIIRNLFIDNNGLIWLGTNGGGINFFNPKRKPFLHYGRKLMYEDQNYSKIRSVLLDSNGFLWMGTEGGGLFHNQGENYESFVNFPSSTRPFALEEVTLQNKRSIWVGSEDAPFLRQIDISSGRPTTVTTNTEFKGSTFAILQDKDGIIWIGTYRGGIHKWVPKADGSFKKTVFKFDKTNKNGLSNSIIRKIFEDNLGNIWIGTGNGLNKIAYADKNLAQPTFQVYTHEVNNPQSLCHNYILDIYESVDGHIWIATLGGGLSSFNPSTQRFTNYGLENGLPNKSIKSILDDNQGHIWIASNKGLSQLNPQTGIIKNYYNESGLQGYEFLEAVALKQYNSTLLFGGSNGFNVFNPEDIRDNTTPPKVVFTEMEVLNQPINIGEKLNERILLSKTLSETEGIELYSEENNFSIGFSSLDYADVESMQYEYKLEGFDKDWVKADVDSRKAIYTNLRPGDYTLQVRAANQDGYWSAEPATLDIKVIPPWYLTWPAFLCYLLAFLGALYLFRHYELINIEEKHELKLERLNKEKREELNQLKLQFFTNVSHELRTPLTLIIAPLEQLMQKSRNFSAEDIQQQYHFMYKNSKYLLRMVNQLLDFRKLDQGKMALTARQGDIISFVKEIIEPFQFLANKQKINFQFASEEVGMFMWFDPAFVEKIVYNLLSNAFKFTPVEGKIQIKLEEVAPPTTLKTKSKHFLKISVSDSGPGMSKKVAKKVFQRFFKEGGKEENKDGAGIGLAYTKNLVERHYGTIQLDTKEGQGATFSVTLPMDREAFGKEEINRKPIEQFDKNADPFEYFMPEPIHGLSTAENSDLADTLPADELPLLLFVDDNADIRRFIQDGLQNNFRVIVAENGKLGYEMATASLPDIIISDIMMPEMDGIEFCQLLKKDTNTSHIPVVLLTAKTATENELEGLQTGADAYVKKPFKLEILKMQLLNIHRQRAKLKERFRKEIILQPSEVTVTSADEQFLKRAVDLVEDHMDDSEFNVEALVKEMFISRSKLYLKIKALTGQSTSEFIRTVRLKRAVQLLEGSDYTIKEIMFMTGFNTASYFSKCFKQQFGMVPSEYVRKKGKKESSVS
ncbi:MAG: two-component regulator propeller domain-containing protein [Bacteroidota bacterium]